MIYDNYRFRIPEGKRIRLIVDTDAKNEGDDQYCIVHALLSPRFDVRGVVAAHFGAEKSATSMLDSFDEIEKILELMAFPKTLAVKGGAHALQGRSPVESDGARLIVEEAMRDDEAPLYVISLGPLTNVASALLMEPAIASRMTAVWIGGGEYPSGGAEYNLYNDIPAARVVMASSLELWQIPRSAYQQVIVSMAELEDRVYPQGALGKYLFEQMEAFGHTPFGRATMRTGEYWCLGDQPAVGVLLFPHNYGYNWVQAPDITDSMHYVQTGRNRPVRVYHTVDTRAIMEDFYAKLKLFVQKQGG